MKALRILLRAAALGILCAVLTAPLAIAQSSPTVVMSGLDNPRGLAFAATGHRHDDDHDDARALYVAEAGRGGTAPCVEVRGGTVCAGETGAVSRLWRGTQTRVVTGLPSYAPFAMGVTDAAIGLQDVSFDDGRGYVAIGLAGDPGVRATLGEHFGTIARFDRDGTVGYEVDVAAHEAQSNPGGGPVESNPNGLLKGDGRELVVDAAANTLLQVDDAGAISTLAVFPSRPQGRATDAVPTAVASRRRASYVAELTGGPFTAGQAQIWRVVPGREPEVHCAGFSFLVDLAFGRDGDLYVLEASGPAGPFSGTPGRLLRVAPDCSTTAVATNLAAPASVAIGPDGDAYVSINSQSAATGAVVRIDLPPAGDDDDDD